MINFVVIGLLGLLICIAIGMLESAGIAMLIGCIRLILRVESDWVRIIVVSILLAFCSLVGWFIVK
ncbi:hypothetical protein Pan241w_41400 [Gimesia alba]|uniref:Uncharacterized protein n=1 Tax=Gimesia alba TaxID=2527973 RepID=A0A517RJI0_9PLAN|nr:hypothetical protein Pan241w_41400 [Gimesia alba]